MPSGKTLLYAKVCIRVREIRIVENPHLKVPSWEGGRGVPQIEYAQRICAEYPKGLFHTRLGQLRRAAADLEGFAHSAAAEVSPKAHRRCVDLS